MQNAVFEKVKTCAELIKEKSGFSPRVGIVLGSGLGAFADSVSIKTVVEYKDIADFPLSTVEGHSGRFVFCNIGPVPCVLMQGRVHYYEGYSMQDVVLPIRVMRLLGAKILFLTNASGAINKDFAPGDLMMITDQISSFVPSPLIGRNISELGERFPDMGGIYSKRLQSILQKNAAALGTPLRGGVYVQASGPAYESPQEVKMFRTLGADAVGMSTACEAIAAVHAGMEVCGVSCISNKAADLITEPLSHEDVQMVAAQASNKLFDLINLCVSEM